MLPPRLFASRNSLPPEGAAAPAAWQSQFRGPCLNGMQKGGIAPTDGLQGLRLRPLLGNAKTTVHFLTQ